MPQTKWRLIYYFASKEFEVIIPKEHNYLNPQTLKVIGIWENYLDAPPHIEKTKQNK